MNYTECFNRSNVDGLQIVCSPFFVWCPRWCQAWSIATVPPLRPSWCLNGARRGVLPPCHLCVPSWCPLRHIIHVIQYY